MWYIKIMLELSERQKDKIVEICRNFGVKILLLFGSQIGGKIHKESDIDLAFASGRSLNFEKAARFNAELQSVFGENKVETVDILKTSPLLKKRIFDEHAALYIDNKFLYYSLASYALKSYIETKFLRENTGKYLNQKYARNW